MAWTITRYPPLPGPHSLGEGVLTFDAQGVAHTDDAATALKAQEFPQTFTVVDEAQAAQEAEAVRHADVEQQAADDAATEAQRHAEASADPKALADPAEEGEEEHGPSARKRSHTRRSEE